MLRYEVPARRGPSPDRMRANSKDAHMPGLIDNTLDEIDSHLRNLRHQLAALEDARRQLVGDEKPLIAGVDGRPQRSASAVT